MERRAGGQVEGMMERGPSIEIDDTPRISKNFPRSVFIFFKIGFDFWPSEQTLGGIALF
jgi:hypothetical protein